MPPGSQAPAQADLVERPFEPDSEGDSEQRVVADLGMGVEREVVRREDQIRPEERLQPAAQAPVDPGAARCARTGRGGRSGAALRRRRPLEELERAGDAAGELRHLVGAEHLQAREAVLREAVDLEQLVRVAG